MIYIIHAFSNHFIKNISSSLALLVDAMSFIILGFLILTCIISIFTPKSSAWFFIKIGIQGLYMTFFTFICILFFIIYQAPSFCQSQMKSPFSFDFSISSNQTPLQMTYQIIQFIVVFATLLYIDKKSIPIKYKIVPYIASFYFTLLWVQNGKVNTIIDSMLYIIYIFIFFYLIYFGFKTFI